MSFWSWLSDSFKKKGTMEGPPRVSPTVEEVKKDEPKPTPIPVPPKEDKESAVPTKPVDPIPSPSSDSSDSPLVDIRWGSLSRRYEVGKGTVATISTGIGDPGGKSYGLWQIASKTGTLADYISKSKYKYKLSSAPIASQAFDRLWKEIAIEDPKGFESDQYKYIKATHFDPAYNYWINNLNGSKDPTVGQVVWSMAVQHGKVKKILMDAALNIKKHLGTASLPLIINELYDARIRYIKTFMQGSMLQSLLNRYKDERKDALNMIK